MFDFIGDIHGHADELEALLNSDVSPKSSFTVGGLTFAANPF